MHFWIKGVCPCVVQQLEVHGRELPWPGDDAHKKQPGLNHSGVIICANASVVTRSKDSFLTAELSCTEPGSDNCWRESSGELSVGSQGCEGVGRKITAGHELKKTAGSTFEPQNHRLRKEHFFECTALLKNTVCMCVGEWFCYDSS